MKTKEKRHLKQRIEDLPIGRKLVFLGLVILFLSMGTMATFLFWAELFLFRHSYTKQLLSEASAIAYGTKAALTFGSAPDAEEALSVLGANEHILAGVLYDAEGKRFAMFLQKPQTLPDPMPIKAPYTSFHWLAGYVEIVEPVRAGDETMGWLLIRGSLAPVFDRLKWNLFLITAAAVVALIVGLFLIWWMREMVAPPLSLLTARVRNHADKMGLAITPGPSSGDEIAVLDTSFQELLDSLQKRNEELSGYRRELERLVAERTKALAEANRQLEEELSHRRRVEEEQRRLVTAIQQSAEGIFLTDENWKILFTNQAFATMVGYDPAELIGQHTRILKSGVHDRAFYSNITKTVTAGHIWGG
ncbi:MAG: PAS domain S-box protein, partial [Syntrophales bacterium]|nr:PAS domain S-box protein [Syntrophales bacterium]